MIQAFGYTINKVKWMRQPCLTCGKVIETGDFVVHKGGRNLHTHCFREWLVDEIKKRELALAKFDLETQQGDRQ
jgi:hypothetical protein